ncbi:MAG: biliverdin-producing heme oxygenase [Herminiimonas sp.]|nr:biliverdin-producing heme oxygenase [Herminiimonas sp.]
MTAPVTTASGILDRLRIETRSDHDAIERVLDIMKPDLSIATYRKQLALFYGFYQPLESSLASLADWSEFGLDFDVRCKSVLLADDLDYVGFDSPCPVPTCTILPPLNSIAAGFGCLYVLEGATLGGQLISRHLAETLGLDGLRGARFFNCYGDRTGMMWKSFRCALAEFATTPEVRNEVVASAAATFRTLRCWCLTGRNK